MKSAPAPVCRGSVGGMSVADRPSVDIAWQRDGEILRCPWHGWEFDIPTGRTITDPTKRIPSYRVVVEEGMVVLELDRPSSARDAAR